MLAQPAFINSSAIHYKKQWAAIFPQKATTAVCLVNKMQHLLNLGKNSAVSLDSEDTRPSCHENLKTFWFEKYVC